MCIVYSLDDEDSIERVCIILPALALLSMHLYRSLKFQCFICLFGQMYIGVKCE